MIRDDVGDKELLAKVAKGDHDAFKQLILRHQAGVFKLAYRYLGDRLEAEEIAQDTFVRLLGAAERYRPEAAFRTYLLKIATNLCLNRRSRLYRQLEERRDPADPQLSGHRTEEPDPEELLLRSEQVQAVRRAVLTLPQDQRMALILFRFQELTYDAIAEVMGKSASAVTSLLWRARERLRQELREWAGEGVAPQDHVESPVRQGREGS